MALSDDMHSISRLAGDAFEQLGKLVQNEAQLARAELSEKLTQAGLGAAYLAVAGILAIPVLVVLLIALALWLTTALGWSPALAHLAAAGAGAAIAIVLALVGCSYFKAENLKPKVTIRQVERDIAAAKEMAR
jgi:hypothetical protein